MVGSGYIFWRVWLFIPNLFIILSKSPEPVLTRCRLRWFFLVGISNVLWTQKICVVYSHIKANRKCAWSVLGWVTDAMTPVPVCDFQHMYLWTPHEPTLLYIVITQIKLTQVGDDWRRQRNKPNWFICQHSQSIIRIVGRTQLNQNATKS